MQISEKDLLRLRHEPRERVKDRLLKEHENQLIHNFIDGYWFRLGEMFEIEHTKLDQDGQPLPKENEQLQLF
jgi:hypothetical protein